MDVGFWNKITARSEAPKSFPQLFPFLCSLSFRFPLPEARGDRASMSPTPARSHHCASQPKPVTSQQVYAKSSLKTAIKIGCEATVSLQKYVIFLFWWCTLLMLLEGFGYNVDSLTSLTPGKPTCRSLILHFPRHGSSRFYKDQTIVMLV